ncbi:MAG: Arm DNA-binding domain-containing protein, partial [Sneathiella sp.]
MYPAVLLGLFGILVFTRPLIFAIIHVSFVGYFVGRNMARSINRLSARKVSTVSDPGKYADGGGLNLQVSGSGSKSWIFRFMLNGRAREMGLGPYHTITLAGAREAATECRRQLLDGFDPIEQRKLKQLQAATANTPSMSFRECSDSYISAKCAEWKNDKHRNQWVSTLKTYVHPIFGDRPVHTIDTMHVMQALEPIWVSKTETASRIRGRIENILDWAATRGYRQGENP